MHMLCFGCAGVFESEDAVIYTCPDCGCQTKKAVYDKLMAHARRAVRYGYQYRSLYESDFAVNGSVTHRLSLPPLNDLFAFAALAAISVATGGHDPATARAALARMRSTASERFGLRNVSLDAPEEVERLFSAVGDYERRLPGLPEPVAMALVEEMVEDEYRTLALREKSALSERKQRELVLKATRKVRKRQGLFPSELKEFWTALPETTR